MSAGVQDFVTINLDTLAAAFDADDKVTIATLQAKRILNLSGREARLPLKVTSPPPTSPPTKYHSPMHLRPVLPHHCGVQAKLWHDFSVRRGGSDERETILSSEAAEPCLRIP